ELARALMHSVQLEPLVEPGSDDGQEIVILPRLFEIMKDCDLVDRADRVRLVRVTGEQDERALRVERAYRQQEADPVQLRHQEVRDHEVERVRLRDLKGAPGGALREHQMWRLALEQR